MSSKAPSTGMSPSVLDMTAPALVECEGVRRAFRRGGTEVIAVRQATCTVRAGMQVVVSGPSGSGKSTLLHLLAGLETPDSGTLRWPGLGAMPHQRPGAVGVVFQGPSLVPALDVIGNVALPLLLADVAEDEAVERGCLALDQLHIGDLSRKLPEELSGGQAQRVAVARVIASRSRLILADEPTGQLDQDTGQQLVSVLLNAAQQLGAGLVVTTHDPAVARRLRRQWRMVDGQLTVCGEQPTGTQAADRPS